MLLLLLGYVIIYNRVIYFKESVTYAYQVDFVCQIYQPPIPVVAHSKAWVCGRSLAGIALSNIAGGMDVCP
jgi:hypothetical protein